MKFLVNPSLAREVELDRPADSWPERIFRFSLFFFCATGIALAVLRLFLDKKTIESNGGLVGAIVGTTFGVCFFYMINYMAWRFVKSRVVKIAWWGLMGLIALMIIVAIALQ